MKGSEASEAPVPKMYSYHYEGKIAVDSGVDPLDRAFDEAQKGAVQTPSFDEAQERSMARFQRIRAGR